MSTAHFLGKGLSKRERQVALALGRGRTVSQIAEDLALSVKTVSTFRARAMKKLRLKTTAELMVNGLSEDLQC